MDNNQPRFYHDAGTEVNPDLVPKPDLCISCKKDPSLAGEGVIELFIRLYPALMHIDSSSGALGTAMNNTIESLIPVLINAP